MKTLRYLLNFQTPAFLGNANQQAQDHATVQAADLAREVRSSAATA